MMSAQHFYQVGLKVSLKNTLNDLRATLKTAARFLPLTISAIGAVGAVGAVGCGSDSTSLDPFDPSAGTAELVASASGLSEGVPRLKLTMVDVGQGDGLVLELPSGAVVAIDGGPTYGNLSNYKDFVGGVSHVDYMVLTHPHSDHYTGLSDAISLMPQDCVARIFDPGYDRPDTTGYEYWKSAAGCRYRAAGKGMSLAFDPQVAMAIIGAASAPYPTNDGWGINNTSLVTYIRYGRFAALLTGDAQTDAEQQVYNDHMVLRANVMKIGHHGSCNATATTFLRSVAPAVALISAATGNDFGHPHCQTLSKLKAQGSHYYRTDVNGTVTIESDGQHYTVTASKGSADDPSCPRICGAPSDF